MQKKDAISIGSGVLLTLASYFLNELWMRGIFATIGFYFLAIGLWQHVESYHWSRLYFVIGCGFIAMGFSYLVTYHIPRYEDKKVAAPTHSQSQESPQSSQQSKTIEPPGVVADNYSHVYIERSLIKGGVIASNDSSAVIKDSLVDLNVEQREIVLGESRRSLEKRWEDLPAEERTKKMSRLSEWENNFRAASNINQRRKLLDQLHELE